MKKSYRYRGANGKTVEKFYNYIPLRYIFAIVLTVFEIVAIIGIVVFLCWRVPYFYIAAWLTEIACVLKIIASDDNPDYKVPWLLTVLVLPVAGFMLYFIFSSRSLKRKYVRRLQDIHERAYQKDDRDTHAALLGEDSTVAGHARMLCNTAGAHLFRGDSVTYYPSGEEMWAALLCDLRGAGAFIFMEYFIIEEGEFWNSILEILREKAAAGVEVKVVYDDIGCMSTLPGNYAKVLGKYGIAATPFSRLRGQADSEFNNRSHRKITVIDGKIGYTGGINLADEYINKKVRFGHWKDVGLRIEGEAVWEMTRLFWMDYGSQVRALPEMGERYYPACPPHSETGYTIPYGDGPRPIYNRGVSKGMIQNMLAGARRYVYMMSPYLIIDNDLCTDIENTALRGVDVRIILPHIPDKKIVFNMTRSFYHRLRAAGVKIYEYEPGFLHAKVYLSDDTCAMVGTVNLDYRSLVHHFENGVWMYKTACLSDIRADFEDTLRKSIPMTGDGKKPSFFARVFRAVVRIFSPLL